MSNVALLVETAELVNIDTALEKTIADLGRMRREIITRLDQRQGASRIADALATGIERAQQQLAKAGSRCRAMAG